MKPALRIVENEPVLAAGFRRKLLDLPFRELHALFRVRTRVRGPHADPTRRRRLSVGDDISQKFS